MWNKRNNIVNTHTDNNTLAELRKRLCHVRVIKRLLKAHIYYPSHTNLYEQLVVIVEATVYYAH